MSVCGPLVGWSVGWLVRRLVGPSVMLSSKSMKNGPLRIVNDLSPDEEKRGTRRKEGWGGRRDGESEKMKKLF